VGGAVQTLVVVGHVSAPMQSFAPVMASDWQAAPAEPHGVHVVPEQNV